LVLATNNAGKPENLGRTHVFSSPQQMKRRHQMMPIPRSASRPKNWGLHASVRHFQQIWASWHGGETPAIVRRYAHLASEHLAAYAGKVEITMGTNQPQQLTARN
jgi:hypothetical protein